MPPSPVQIHHSRHSRPSSVAKTHRLYTQTPMLLGYGKLFTFNAQPPNIRSLDRQQRRHAEGCLTVRRDSPVWASALQCFDRLLDGLERDGLAEE